MKHMIKPSQLSVEKPTSPLTKRAPQAPDNYLTLAGSRVGAVQGKKGEVL
jgi:hypothetical protein